MPNPTLISVERKMRASADAVWACWCTPELMAQWMAPAPIGVRVLSFEPRPGGTFAIEHALPDGSTARRRACVLDVAPGRRVVFTNALGPGFAPARADDPLFICTVEIIPHETGCGHKLSVSYQDAAACEASRSAGVHHGWGAMIETLDDVAQAQMGR